MQKIVNGIFRNQAARALILLVLIIPVSVYLGTTPVRRGFLYYTEILAPAAVAAIAAGLWTWSWQWLCIVFGASIVLTVLIQALFHLLW